MTKISIKAVSFILSLAFLFLIPLNVYAFDENYIKSSSNWYKKGEIATVTDGTFTGQLKYIIDSSDGCAYFYLNFSDKEIKTRSASDICLSFSVENSADSYFFAVCKNGFTSDSDKNIEDSIEIYYNFDGLSCKNGSGNILLGFRLKNITDRKLLSTIKCSFVKSTSSKVTLLENAQLDMFVPTTQKTTTAKTTKAATTKSSSSSKTAKSKKSSSKTGSSSSKSTTKFKASSKSAATKKSSSSSQNSSTKFTAGSVTSDTASDSSEKVQTETQAAAEETITSQSSSADSQSAKTASGFTMTDSSKKMIIASIVLFVAGVICVIIGVVAKKYKIVKNDGNHNNDNN